jgi:hypothetical protein
MSGGFRPTFASFLGLFHIFFHRCGKLGWRPYPESAKQEDGQSNTVPTTLTVLQNLRYYLSFAFIAAVPR